VTTVQVGKLARLPSVYGAFKRLSIDFGWNMHYLSGRAGKGAL